MTPQDFIQKWGPGGPAFGLNEEQGAQSHFLDLCELLAVPKPGSEAGYLFEEKGSVIGGRTGFADVFRRGAFAWENKARRKSFGTTSIAVTVHQKANKPLRFELESDLN